MVKTYKCRLHISLPWSQLEGSFPIRGFIRGDDRWQAARDRADSDTEDSASSISLGSSSEDVCSTSMVCDSSDLDFLDLSSTTEEEEEDDEDEEQEEEDDDVNAADDGRGGNDGGAGGAGGAGGNVAGGGEEGGTQEDRRPSRVPHGKRKGGPEAKWIAVKRRK